MQYLRWVKRDHFVFISRRKSYAGNGKCATLNECCKKKEKADVFFFIKRNCFVTSFPPPIDDL